MTDRRNYPHPQKPAQYLTTDLDDRTPLTDIEAEVLNEEIMRLIDERARIGEDIRKINRRLMLSAEVKVKEIRNGS